MFKYRVYAFDSSRCESIEAKYPQDAVVELVMRKCKLDKRFIHIQKVGTPIQAAHKSRDTLGFIVVGIDAILHFYLVKLDLTGFNISASTSKPKNNKLAFTIHVTNHLENRDIPLYINPSDSPSNQIWGIIVQLMKNNATPSNWVRVANNHFKCTTKSMGGNDYDDPEIEIMVDNNRNAMRIVAYNSYNKRYEKITSANDMTSLHEALIFAEMIE